MLNLLAQEINIAKLSNGRSIANFDFQKAKNEF